MHDKKFDPKDKTSDGCNNSMSCAVFMACVFMCVIKIARIRRAPVMF
jgi:hypothetical protein